MISLRQSQNIGGTAADRAGQRADALQLPAERPHRSRRHQHQRDCAASRGDRLQPNLLLLRPVDPVLKGKDVHLSDLEGKTIAVDRGSNAGDNWLAWLKAHGHAGDTHLQTFGSKQASLSAVETGAVSGYVEDYELLAAFARTNPRLYVIRDPGGVGVKLDGVGMHKNDSLLMLKVDLALQHIETAGEYATIYNKWFGPRSATPVPLMGQIEVWPNG